MGSIQLKDVRKAFGAVSVINGVNLDIEDGEFAVFVGPSGCGKSTLLRLIAGLEDVTVRTGADRREGHDQRRAVEARPRHGVPVLRALSAHERAQQHRLRAQDGGAELDMIEQKVRKAAATLNLTDYLDRKPRQLSGGQRQRVAIGRAIVREPKAFLFDEPLSNLDAALRVQMRVEIGELHEALKTTMIYVTHDQVEAMTMADKIVVLDRGSVAQVGSPLELYNKPNGLFVAGFIGSPTMNLVKGPSAAKRGAETIGIRPEHADVSTTAGEWPATVRLAEHLGSDTFVHAEADGIGPFTLRLEGEAPLTPGQKIFVTPREAHLHRFDKDGRRIN